MEIGAKPKPPRKGRLKFRRPNPHSNPPNAQPDRVRHLVAALKTCYHLRCIKSWEFHANLLFTRKGKVDGYKTDVARQSNPNPLDAGIFLPVEQAMQTPPRPYRMRQPQKWRCYLS